jgi:hypothetical protein
LEKLTSVDGTLLLLRLASSTAESPANIYESHVFVTRQAVTVKRLQELQTEHALEHAGTLLSLLLRLASSAAESAAETPECNCEAGRQQQ